MTKFRISEWFFRLFHLDLLNVSFLIILYLLTIFWGTLLFTFILSYRRCYSLINLTFFVLFYMIVILIYNVFLSFFPCLIPDLRWSIILKWLSLVELVYLIINTFKYKLDSFIIIFFFISLFITFGAGFYCCWLCLQMGWYGERRRIHLLFRIFVATLVIFLC